LFATRIWEICEPGPKGPGLHSKDPAYIGT
jgi:hypothetical protein